MFSFSELSGEALAVWGSSVPGSTGELTVDLGFGDGYADDRPEYDLVELVSPGVDGCGCYSVRHVLTSSQSIGSVRGRLRI